MNIDMDEYLDQYEIDPQSTQGPPNNMNDAFQNRFELDPFSFHHSHDDNQGLDVFSNNNGSGNGGQGSLSYFGNEEQQQQHFFDSSGLDGHFSAPNSQHGHDRHQLANSSSFDSHYSHQDAQHDQDPTTGQVENTADSLEHDNTVLEGEEVDVGPLKNEERDSDDEFEEDDEDKGVDQEAEDGEDGQKKKTKRKPYSDPRSLIRWHTGKDQLALMALIYELEMRGIQVPYGRVCRHVQADCAEKGDAMIQHLTKARKARIYYGLPVPPPLPSKKKISKDGKNTTDDLGQVSEKDIKMWNTLTYTRPGRDDQSDGTPGTMPPEYTPVMIRPDLSYYDYAAESTMNMPPWPETPAPKAPRAPKTASAPSKKKGKQTVKQDADKEESAPAASTEKKGRSSKKAVKAEQDGDATYSEKPTRKAQSTPAASKRKTAAKPATKATPSKPRGVTKSKKTPATLNKKLSGLSVHEPAALEQAATPSKKPGASKKKAKVNVAPMLEEPTASEATPVAINNAEQSTQSYGRVSREAPGMPAQSFEHMLADLPPENFQMGRHQASQSFGSQSTMSTVLSQSMLDNSAQFMPNNFHVPMQNGYSGHNYHSNGYGHYMMPNHNSFFAHGHGASAMVPGGKEQDIQHFGVQGQGGHPMQQYNNNNSYDYSNVHNYGPGPHGLGIMHDGTLLPREPIQLDPELSNYSFDSGPANNMTAQQQLSSNDDFQMQTNNDIKPDMDQHMGDFTDMSGFEDGSNIFNDVEQTTLYH